MSKMIPTTPDRNTPENDIVDNDSSLVLSPLYNDNNNNIDSDQYQMKGYDHGLSSKKKVDHHLMNFNLVKDTTPTLLYADKKQTTRNLSVVNNDISDLSLEVGRNEEEENNINDEPDVSGLEQTVGKTLEQLDVNRPLTNKIQSNGKILNISSPEKHHLSENTDENDSINKRQKLEQSQIAEDNNDSPAMIEMIEHQNNDTPQKDNTANRRESNIFTTERSSPTSSNHMLSPIIQTNNTKTFPAGNQNDDDEQDTEFINMVSRRNMELSEDIHQVNIKMNNLAMDYQKLTKKYQKYQDIITDLNKDLDLANIKKQELQEQNDNQQKSIEPLKIKLKEFVNEIKMLNSNQTLLQKKYDTVSLLSEKYEKEQKHLEETINNLNMEISKNKVLFEQSSNELESHKEKLNNTESEYEKLLQQNETLKEGRNKFETDIKMKDEQVSNLQETIEQMKNSEMSNSTELSEQIKVLTEEQKDLTSKLISLEDAKQIEIKKLTEETASYKKTAEELSEKINNLSKALDEANATLKNRDNTITELNKKLEESNDECNVRIAEVTELNIEIESLKESKIHFEEANNRLQEELNANQIKTQNETDQYKKTSIELESVQIKSNNIETQYLKEIGDLQSTISSLGDTLESAQKSTDDTMKENEQLKKEVELLKNRQLEHVADDSQKEEISELKSKLQLLQKEVDEAKTTSITSHQVNNDEVETLKAQIDNWKLKLEEKEKDTNKRLRLLAEDLYHQYSSKHEQKVKSLKKSYEKKYETQIEKLTVEQQALKEEIERVTKQLNLEREEKRELIRTMDGSAK